MDEVKVPADGRRRLTRAEQQARTRQAILDAAAEVFAERGFGATSVEAVVARAGYTRGAFYSNFGDKDDLFLAVLDQRTKADVTELGPLVEVASSPEDLMRRLRAARPPGQIDRQWMMLLTEFRLHALRNPEARPLLAAWEQRERTAFRDGVERTFATAGVTPPGDPELIALVLQVLDHGIAMHHEIELDAIAPRAFFDALDLLLRAALALAERSETDT